MKKKNLIGLIMSKKYAMQSQLGIVSWNGLIDVIRNFNDVVHSSVYQLEYINEKYK